MPTYEYRCGACGHRFEVFQKISEGPVRACPECGEDAAERLISAGGGLVFKGTGFYATDYRKDGPSGGSEERSDGKESGGGSEKEKKGDSSAGGSAPGGEE